MKDGRKTNILILRIFVNPITKWVLIPFVLLLFWLTLSMLYGSYKSVSVLQYIQNQNSKNNFFSKKLFREQKLTGDFIAKDNHLGIIAVGFSNVPRVDYNSEDLILFRIREKNNNKWLYENTYRSGAFVSYDYYPFGFKEISDSKGKEYIFEIISNQGNNKNALETKNYNPVYLIKYKYPKREIFGSFSALGKFIVEKLITFFTNFELLLSSVVFLLPFIFYMTWTILSIKKFEWLVSSQKKWVNKRLNARNVLGLLVIGLLYYDIIFYNFINTGFMLGILGLWIGIVLLNKYKSNVTFILAFSLITISIIAIYFHLNISINKSSAFVYYLMMIATIQSIYEYKSIIGKKSVKNRR